MPYQIIAAAMARSLQDDAARAHLLFAWIIMRDLPDYPGALAARLVTDAPTPYILLGHTLAELPPPAAQPGALKAPTVRPAGGRGSMVFRVRVISPRRVPWSPIYSTNTTQWSRPR
jgi:hypothetical protein